MGWSSTSLLGHKTFDWKSPLYFQTLIRKSITRSTQGQSCVGFTFSPNPALLKRYLLTNISLRCDPSFRIFWDDTYSADPYLYITTSPFQHISNKAYLDISTCRGYLKNFLSIATSQPWTNRGSTTLPGSLEPIQLM